MKIFLIFVFIVFLSLNVYAHKPIEVSQSATKGEPIVVKEHKISQVAYSELTDIKDVDYYMLVSVKEEEKIYTKILVPKIDRLKDFEPEIGIIGPQLKKETDGLKEEIIEKVLDVNSGEGVIIKKNIQKSETFFEPFTQTRYWKRQEIEISAPVDGDYYIVVFDMEGDADKYVLSIGKEEKWSMGDLIKLPGIWWDVRMFTEKQESTYIITLLIILFILFFAVKIILTLIK